MKRKDLVNKLEGGGFEMVREGSEHSIYRNQKTKIQVSVPRHRELNEITAKKILKEAGLK